MSALHTIFGESHQLTWLQECARAVLIFTFGLVLVRLAGRRVFGKWSALDIVVSIIIGSSLSRAMTGSAPLIGTMAASVVLVLLHGVAAKIAARSEGFRRIIEGRAIDLVRNGRIDQDARLGNSVSDADLAEALRKAGIADAECAALVTLEPSGAITAVKRG